MAFSWKLPLLRRSTVARRSLRIPVLLHHAAHAHGDDYAGNDHLALERDLELIRELQFKVAKLDDVAALRRRSLLAEIGSPSRSTMRRTASTTISCIRISAV